MILLQWHDPHLSSTACPLFGTADVHKVGGLDNGVPGAPRFEKHVFRNPELGILPADIGRARNALCPARSGP